MSIQILIADDHGVLRAGLRALLNVESDLEVIAEVADDHEIIRVANKNQIPIPLYSPKNQSSVYKL